MSKLFKIGLFLCLSTIFVFTLTLGYSGIFKRDGNTLLRQQFPLFSEVQAYVFAALPHSSLDIKTAVASQDARPILIEKYLKYYNSPMQGHGDYIVKTSDHFGLDPYLVVAIAQQESNLGKLMPPDCHNAWGWGIHSAGTLCFGTWQEGINTFIKGLSEKYLAYGLKTPDEIMTKYNPTSPGGSWAKGVNQFLSQLNSGDW